MRELAPLSVGVGPLVGRRDKTQGLTWRLMNILIIGGNGFLGRELARQARRTGHAVTATFASRAGDISGIRWLPMDLRRSEEITQVLKGTQPDVVINAAYRKADCEPFRV